MHYPKSKTKSYSRASQAGFTLIELLVVITVIGLLSSMILVGLQGVRAQGRDTRRIADLRNVQNALELYFNAYASYPAGSSWDTLQSSLARVGVSKLPSDPLNRDPYVYVYVTSSDGLRYILKATLEDANNPALRDTLKDTEMPPGITSPGCSVPAYCIGV